MANWRIYAGAPTADSTTSFAVIEAGLSDENLNMVLPAGYSADLPEIFIYQLPEGEAHLGAPILHRYLNKYLSASIKDDMPVVYNTWFDCWDILDIGRLREQLAASRKIGCDVFMIDAGWYGAEEGNWAFQVGDWREKLNGAFHGRMAEFAEEVCSAGLGFGIWVEPERIGSEAPVLKEHPEWFLPA